MQPTATPYCALRQSGQLYCNEDARVKYPLLPISVPTSVLAPRGFYRLAGGVDIVQCPGSTFSNTSGAVSSACSGPCMAGYMGSSNESISIKFVDSTCNGRCPLGHWCPLGTADPIPCPAGTYGAEEGLSTSACSGRCPKGSYCGIATVFPDNCLAGFYGNMTGLHAPTCSGACDAGYICMAGSISPQQYACPAGQYNSVPGSSSCSDCSPGYATAMSASTKCDVCPAGTYSNAAISATQCLICAPGTYSSAAASTSCSQCSPGQSAEMRQNGSTSCRACPPSRYTDGNNTIACLQCPVGTFTLTAGSTSCSLCSRIRGISCRDGYVSVSSFYHADLLVTTDAQSVDGSGVAVSLSTQECPRGYCRGIPNVAEHVNLTTLFAQVQQAETDALTLSVPDQCSLHRLQDSQTLLCGKCEANFAPNDVGSSRSGCSPCDGLSFIKLGIFIGFPWLLVILYVFANGRLGLISLTLYYIQTIAVILSSQSTLTTWIRSFGLTNTFDFLVTNHCLAPMSPYLQYCLPLFVPMMQLIQLAIIVIVHLSLRRACQSRSAQSDRLLDASLSHYAMVEQESDDSCKHFCMNIWPQLTVSTITRTVFLILMASFNSVMFNCIAWFRCVGGIVYEFPAISCLSSEYEDWTVLIMVYVIGWLLLIAVMFVWLVQHRLLLSKIQLLPEVTCAISNKPDFFFSSPFPTLLQPLSIVKADSNSALDLNEQLKSVSIPLLHHISFRWFWLAFVEEQHESESAIDLDGPIVSLRSAYYLETHNFVESRRLYAFRSVFGSIFDAFSPRATIWIIVILLRRLILIAVSITLVLLPTFQQATFIGFHMINYAIHTQTQPYRRRALNDIEALSILVHILISVVTGLFGQRDDANDEQLNAALLTLTVAPVVGVVIYFLVKWSIDKRSRSFRQL